jgi:hypothetical protein
MTIRQLPPDPLAVQQRVARPVRARLAGASGLRHTANWPPNGLLSDAPPSPQDIC